MYVLKSIQGEYWQTKNKWSKSISEAHKFENIRIAMRKRSWYSFIYGNKLIQVIQITK